MSKWITLCAALGLSLASAATPAAAGGPGATRPIGDTRVFAVVPDPGQPSGIAVDGDSVLVTTMGLVNQPVTDPRLFSFERGAGGVRTSTTIPRMMAATAMALLDVALDAAGRAYVVDMNGRILRIDPATGEQEVYAEFPGAAAGLAAMPFGLAFDRTGVAYVTDQNLPGIWRVPPGGGSPEIWFQDPRLASYLLGASGIRLDPTGRHLYFTVASALASGGQGVVYRLPVDDPSPSRLEEIFRYPARTNPFALAFGASGKLYVTLYGSHQVSILRPDGTEERRFPSPEENGQRNVPFDRPASAAFDGEGSLLVTNSASFSSPGRQVVFDVFVGDLGVPLLRPVIPPGSPAAMTSARPHGRAGGEIRALVSSAERRFAAPASSVDRVPAAPAGERGSWETGELYRAPASDLAASGRRAIPSGSRPRHGRSLILLAAAVVPIVVALTLATQRTAVRPPETEPSMSNRGF